MYEKNMLLAGIWYSKDKPTMTTFLKPIIEEINELYTHGNITCMIIIIHMHNVCDNIYYMMVY